MNKQLYFVFGFLSAILLTSMFATVSAAGIGDWVRSAFAPAKVAPEAESDAGIDLSPMPSGSPYACSANTDTKTRTLQACQWVKSPLGQFTNLESDYLNVKNSIVAPYFKTTNIESSSNLRMVANGQFKIDSIYPGENAYIGLEAVNSLGGPRTMLEIRPSGILVSADGGDGVLVTDDLLVHEGFDVGGSVTLTGLTGTGNDYACIDANGRLFRSNTAC